MTICRASCSQLDAFWVRFEYTGAENPSRETRRMFQHPQKGDMVLKDGHYYDIKQVTYDMYNNRVVLECVLRGQERL